MELWEQQGIASFVCASVDQKPYETEAFLREALKRQCPKVVVLETNVLYRAYSCREGAYLPVQQLAAQPLVILEGSYSHHPLLAPYEDFRVFMTCSDAEQTRRLQAREGDRYPDFAARWVPLEEAYFTQHNIEDAADFVMDTTTD